MFGAVTEKLFENVHPVSVPKFEFQLFPNSSFMKTCTQEGSK